MITVSITFINNRLDFENDAMLKASERVQKIYTDNKRGRLTDETLSEVINSMSVAKDMRFFLLNINLEALNADHSEDIQEELVDDLKIILDGNTVFRNRIYSNLSNDWMLFYGAPLYENNDIIGAILVYTPYNDVFDSVIDTLIQIITLGLLGWLLATLILYRVTKSITSPIETIEKNALALAQGQDVQDLHIQGDDEISSLTLSFNAMKNAIKQMNEERNTFIGMVSHELKTPLMSINGYLEALQDGVIDDQEEALEIIYSESQRLTKMTKDLVSNMRDYKGFTYAPETVELKPLLESQIKLFLDKDISLTCHQDQKIYCDPDQMIQIIKNLLSNAVKYSESNSDISIEVRDADKRLEISITDHGYGMNKNDLDNLFNPYFRSEKTKDLVEGSGVGMSVVKQLVHLQGGTIKVKSKVNIGTTVTMTFKGDTYV